MPLLVVCVKSGCRFFSRIYSSNKTTKNDTVLWGIVIAIAIFLVFQYIF